MSDGPDETNVFPSSGRPAFWPDIDVYFKRDLALALRMVEQLQRMGVTTIKTAALHDPECCLDTGDLVQYHVAGEGARSEPYRRVIERHVVDLATLRRICGEVKARGLNLVLSVYDTAGIDLAREYAASALKVPSSNIVHAHLIQAAAASGIPLVIDTGRSELSEIDRAVQWARQAGAVRLLVQHSPPGPPAAAKDFHLAMMPALGRRYGVPYGLSDHHAGIQMFPLAVALGASVIEKGVCADGSGADIDIAHALPLSEVPQALSAIRAASEAIGTPDLSDRRGRPRPLDRMGLVAAVDLEPGALLTEASVRFAFPTVGIPAEAWNDVRGCPIGIGLKAGEPIRHGHLRAK